jgi:CBS domain-containing protein
MKFTSAKDLMTTDVKSVDAEWPVNRVAQFLIDHEISGAPVVKDGALIGVVSLTDLARHNSASGETSRRPASFYRAELEAEYAEEEIDQLRVSDSAGTTAEHVMTPQVYDVSPHTSIKQVAQVMHRGGIHRLFVTESGHIKGVISALDMLKVIAEE